MAHFMDAKGTRISKSIQTATVGVPVTIGVYGAAGLSVGPNDRNIASIKSLGKDQKDNYWYELKGLRNGHVMVEAKQGASVWDYYQLAVQTVAAGPPAPPAPNADGRYTTDNKERPARTTKATPAEMRTLCASAWPALDAEGRNSLICHYMHETGGGSSCFNWNFGNVRANSTSVLHMYLKNVAEYLPSSVAQPELESGKQTGLARPPTAEERKRWPNRAGKVTVIFNPPHAGARFRAYDSILEGGQGLVGKYKSIGGRFPDYLPALNRGDFEAIANILLQANYFTGDTAAYARNMRAWRARI